MASSVRAIQCVALLAAVVTKVTGIGCLDENLQEVGWWVIMKQNGGLRYSYMDGSSSATVRPRVNGITLDSYTNSLGECAYCQHRHRHADRPGSTCVVAGGTLQQIIDMCVQINVCALRLLSRYSIFLAQAIPTRSGHVE